MKITTEKPVAIVLGGTNPHKELVLLLQKRGFFVVLIDYLLSPPAASISDYHLRESTLDKDKVLEVARTLNAQLVVALCIDQANVTACYVSEKLSLPCSYGYETALLISDKIEMKMKMAEVGIPTSNFISIQQDEPTEVERLKFPLVVKPSDSNGSKGVRVVDNKYELQEYLKEALVISRNGKAIVEEFLFGDELGVDCFIADGQAHIISTHKKRKPLLKNDTVIFSIGSISPALVSNQALENISAIATKIAIGFGLNNVPLLLQVMVSESSVQVIEFAPRIGGGLNFRKIPKYTGFDILEASLESWMGNVIIPVYSAPGNLYSENHLYTESGIFGRIEGIKELVENGTIVEFYPNKKTGDKILPGNASKDRAGSFIVEGKNIDEVKEKIQKSINSISVFDEQGQPLRFLQNYESLLL